MQDNKYPKYFELSIILYWMKYLITFKSIYKWCFSQFKDTLQSRASAITRILKEQKY